MWRQAKFLLVAVALLTGALAIACQQGEEKAPPPAARTPASGEGQVIIRAIPTLKFDTKELRVPANTQVTILFVNDDTAVPHDFTIWTKKDGKKIAGTEIITGPARQSITVNLAPGQYYFNCTVHPTEMEGKVIAQ
jgi:plastocyanin